MPGPLICAPTIALPITITTATPASTTLVLNPRRFIVSPVSVDCASLGFGGLADLVPDRRHGLEVLRDREPVRLGQVLVPGQRALDDLGHETAGHVTVRLGTGFEEIRDLVFAPLAETGLRVRRDIGHGITIGSVGRAPEKPRVVGRLRQRSRRVAFTAVANGAHEILAAAASRGGRGGRRGLP